MYRQSLTSERSMSSSSRLLLIVTASVVAGAACWAPRAPLQAPAPDRYAAYGDTSRFGPVVTAVDSNAQFVQLSLREPSRVEVFTIDREYRVRAVASCYAEAGTHTVKPANVGTYRIGRDAILVVVIGEEPRYRASCDVPSTSNRSNFTAAVSAIPGRNGLGTMPPNEALQRLPVALLRYPESSWASYIVEP